MSFPILQNFFPRRVGLEGLRTTLSIESRRACRELVERGRLRGSRVQISFADRLIRTAVVKNKSAIGITAISPVGTAENSPGRQSWVNWTTRECYGNHSRPTRFSLGYFNAERPCFSLS